MKGMLSRAPANLPPLVTGQSFSSADSNKLLCTAWPPGFERGDFVFEPTSVLDIRSPSPSSTLSSSFAGSCEGGLGSIESGAVDVSGLLICDAASDGQLPDCTSFLVSNEGSVWEVAGQNGRSSEQDFPMASNWNSGTEMGSEERGAWERSHHEQGRVTLGARKNCEGSSGGLNGEGGSIVGSMSTENNMGGVVYSSGGTSNMGFLKQGIEARENWVKTEAKMEGEGRMQVGGEAKAMMEERLEAFVLSYLQSKKRDQGGSIGEVVQRGGGVVAKVEEEEWLTDWNEFQLTEAVGLNVAVAAVQGQQQQLGRMEDFDEMLLSSPAPPAAEWWLGEGAEAAAPLQAAAQGCQFQQQQLAAGGGGNKLQLDLHDVLQAGLVRRGYGGGSITGGSAPPSRGSAPVSGSSLPDPPPAPNFIPISAFSLSNSFPPSTTSLPTHHLEQHPSASLFANSKFLPPPALLANTTTFATPPLPPHMPYHHQSALPSEHLPRSRFFPLPLDIPRNDQPLGLIKSESLQKQNQWQIKPPEDPFARFVKSPSVLLPQRSRHILERRCVEMNVCLEELVAAGRQLAMAAEAVDEGNMVLVQAILARLNQQNSPQGQPWQRAVFHFKEALAKRVAGSGSFGNSPLEIIKKITAYKSFCEASPLPQFAHFTANQAILEAMEGEDRIHLIDFELGLGGQWASFMQEISQRSRAPPEFLRITTIGAHDSLEMQLTKENLQQFAKDLNISLQFYALPIARLDCLSASMILPGEKEAVAVNFGSGLNRLLCDFSCEESRANFLHLIKSLCPKVVTVVDNECEWDESTNFFDFLQFYACLFESLESSKLTKEMVFSIEDVIFAPKIASVVMNARRQKENLAHWRILLDRAGFSISPFSNAAETQAEYLIKNLNTGFTFEKHQGSLLLGWYRRVLVSASTWIC